MLSAGTESVQVDLFTFVKTLDPSLGGVVASHNNDFKPLQPRYLQLIVFQFVLLKTVEKWLCGFY